MALALYVFMADAIRVSGGGVEALRNLLPTRFNWPLFCVALVLMAAPVIRWAYERRPERSGKLENVEVS